MRTRGGILRVAFSPPCPPIEVPTAGIYIRKLGSHRGHFRTLEVVTPVGLQFDSFEQCKVSGGRADRGRVGAGAQIFGAHAARRHRTGVVIAGLKKKKGNYPPAL